jgi:hypothetical protein
MGSGSSIVGRTVKLKNNTTTAFGSISISRERFYRVFLADDHNMPHSLRIDRLHHGLENVRSSSLPVCQLPRSARTAAQQYIATILVAAVLYRFKCWKCSSGCPLRDGSSSVCISSFVSLVTFIKLCQPDLKEVVKGAYDFVSSFHGVNSCSQQSSHGCFRIL